jgi:carbon-monoxide dehydrogenase medium subunit
VKPAAFTYIRAGSLDEALAAMAAHADDAKALAGGQSLVPAMNFRIAQPAVLVDLNSLSVLDYVDASADGLRVGAMTRHRTLERSARVREAAPLVAEAMPHVAHVPIRTRGTLGGSLAHADPAAELPAVMLALDATIEARSQKGTRTIAATEFFTGLFGTALEADELATAVTLPSRPAGEGWAFEEVARRHGDFALAGVATTVTLSDRGAVSSARIALFSVHERAILAGAAARVLVGEQPTSEAVDAAADAAATHDADPASDIHASSAYRRHLTRVLVRRALVRALERARPDA